MTDTRKAVQIIWTNAEGSQSITLDFIAPSTAEAVCMMLDHMEGAGLNLEEIDGMAIVAKGGIGAELLMAAADTNFIKRQAHRVNVAASCAS